MKRVDFIKFHPSDRLRKEYTSSLVLGKSKFDDIDVQLIGFLTEFLEGLLIQFTSNDFRVKNIRPL